MYDFVVQKVEKRGTAVIDDQIVTFGSFGGNYLPSKLYRRKNFTTFSYYNGTAVSANDYFEEVVFEDYDSFGNLEQYTTKDGITTTITYTGDGRFPASKQISNGTKSQTQYYNWNRLQGMTEYVDPTGVSIFYKYDGNGRLQHVENDDQRKVKTYEYHYGD